MRTVKTTDIPFKVVIGDRLKVTLKPDRPTTLWTIQKITDIESDGTIRIECINPKCTKKGCTYLQLSDYELSKLVKNNRYKKSQRLGGITL